MPKRRKRKESSRKRSSTAKRRSSRRQRKNPYLLFIVLGGLVLSLGGGYALYRVITKEGTVVATEIDVDAAFLEQTSDKVDRLWVKYDSNRVDFETGSDEALSDAEAMLGEMVRLQSELVQKTPDAVYGGSLYDRLELFETELNRVRANRLNRQLAPIEDAMAQAKKAKEKGREQDLLRQAIRIQSEMNEIKGAKSFSNPVKLKSFKDRLEKLEIGDRYNECLEFERVADKSLLIHDFEKALESYNNAVDIQLEIISSYPESTYARVTRLDRLERKRDSAHVSQVMARIDSSLSEIDRLEAEMNVPAALALMDRAIVDYQGLIDDYVLFLDDEETFLAMLEQRKAQLTLLPKWTQLKEMEVTLNATLRTGTFSQVNASLNEMLLVLAALDEYNLDLRPYQKELSSRLRYMETMKDLIPLVREKISPHLVVKDSFSYALYDAEVSQALFSFLEGYNPSASQGDEFPVESVNYADAVLFCRHLSWLLGGTVRLPFRGEIEALKAINKDDCWDSAYVWGARNSSMRVYQVRQKKPDASGAYDLWGNVSEWLQMSSDGTYTILERSSMTSKASDIFFREVDAGYRNRFLGFRFVLVWDDMEKTQ